MHITQVKLHDCGVCALANVLGVSYEDSFNTLFPVVGRKYKFGTKTKQLIAAAEQLGFNPPQRKLKQVYQWAYVPTNSIVKVCPRKYSWHWVAYIDGIVYDSECDVPLTRDNLTFAPFAYITLK